MGLYEFDCLLCNMIIQRDPGLDVRGGKGVVKSTLLTCTIVGLRGDM